MEDHSRRSMLKATFASASIFAIGGNPAPRSDMRAPLVKASVQSWAVNNISTATSDGSITDVVFEGPSSELTFTWDRFDTPPEPDFTVSIRATNTTQNSHISDSAAFNFEPLVSVSQYSGLSNTMSGSETKTFTEVFSGTSFPVSVTNNHSGLSVSDFESSVEGDTQVTELECRLEVVSNGTDTEVDTYTVSVTNETPNLSIWQHPHANPLGVSAVNDIGGLGEMGRRWKNNGNGDSGFEFPPVLYEAGNSLINGVVGGAIGFSGFSILNKWHGAVQSENNDGVKFEAMSVNEDYGHAYGVRDDGVVAVIDMTDGSIISSVIPSWDEDGMSYVGCTFKDDTVYVAANDHIGSFTVDSSGNISEEFSFDFTGEQINHVPSLTGDEVVFGVSDMVYSLDPSNFSVQWSQSFVGTVSNVAVSGNTVYVNPNNAANLYAINITDGSIKWASETLQDTASGFVAVDDSIYTTAGTYMYKINRADGTILFEYDYGTQFKGNIAINNNVAWFVTTDDTVVSLAKETHDVTTPISVSETANNVSCTDNAVYVAHTGFVSAYDDEHYTLGNSQNQTGEWLYEGLSTTSPPSSPKWTHTASANCSYPTIRGLLFVQLDTGEVLAISPDDGSVIWDTYDPTTIDPRYLNGTALSHAEVIDGSVYVKALNSDNSSESLFKVNMKNGNNQTFSQGDYYETSSNTVQTNAGPKYYEGTIVFADGNGTIHAVDETQGSADWTMNNSSTISSTPAIESGVVYYGDESGDVFALDITDGSELWRYPTGDGISDGVIYYNDLIIAVTNSQNIYSINASDGTPNWSKTVSSTITTPPSVKNGSVFFGDSSGNFYSLDVATGDIQWSNGIDGTSFIMKPIVTQSSMYSAAGNTLYSINPDTGAVQWTYSLPEAPNKHGAMKGSSLYVTVNDTILCFN